MVREKRTVNTLLSFNGLLQDWARSFSRPEFPAQNPNGTILATRPVRQLLIAGPCAWCA